MRRHLLRLIFGIFLCFLIAIIVPANRGQGFWAFLHDIPLGDKMGHVGLVGTLALLLNLILRGSVAPRPFRPILLGSLIVAVAMTLEELSQAFIPSRSLDALDWLANMIGVVVGEFTARWMIRRSVDQTNG